MMAVVVGWVGRMVRMEVEMEEAAEVRRVVRRVVRMEVEMEEVAEVRMIFIVVVGGLVGGLGGGRERCR